MGVVGATWPIFFLNFGVLSFLYNGCKLVARHFKFGFQIDVYGYYRFIFVLFMYAVINFCISVSKLRSVNFSINEYWLMMDYPHRKGCLGSRDLFNCGEITDDWYLGNGTIQRSNYDGRLSNGTSTNDLEWPWKSLLLFLTPTPLKYRPSAY